MKLQSLSLTVHNLGKRKPNKRRNAGEFIKLMSTNYNLTVTCLLEHFYFCFSSLAAIPPPPSFFFLYVSSCSIVCDSD